MMTKEARRTQAEIASTMLVLALGCTIGPAGGTGATDGHPLSVVGRIPDAEDVSAVTPVGRFLVLGSDEGRSIVVLESAGEGGSWRAPGPPIPLLATESEVDIEALASHGRTVYVLGSHSLKRPLLKAGASHADNRRRLARIVAERSRDHLFRLDLDLETGRLASPVTDIDLRPILLRDEIVGPFARIPGKENGIDLEGLATDGSSLLVGFRTPVLREGWVPVMVLSFADPERYELRFLDLGGQGIRGMCAVSDGFLVLGGPPRAEEGVYRLWWWNGRDGVPGGGGVLRPVGLVEPAGGRPEGIALVEESDAAYEVIVVRDGLPNGAPRRERFARSPSPRGGAPFGPTRGPAPASVR